MEPPATYLSVLQKNKAKQSKGKQKNKTRVLGYFLGLGFQNPGKNSTILTDSLFTEKKLEN
jgi:hypothetical protein